MRLLTISVLFMASASISAQLLELFGAAKGAAALGSSVAALAASVLPAGLLLPLAIIGPLPLTLPVIFGVKTLALLKLKLIGLKTVAVIAPIGIGAAKVAVVKAKLGLAKTAIAAAREAGTGLIYLPFKIGAMTIGAIAGAKEGVRAGVEIAKSLPPAKFDHPMVIPASALLNQVRPQAEPKEYTLTATEEPQVEEDTYTTEPQLTYRRRRASSLDIQTVRRAFEYIKSSDQDQCILRVICEVSADPEVAEGQSDNIMGFMFSLSGENTKEPWIPYQDASLLGLETQSRPECHSKYSLCRKDTREILHRALRRIRVDGD